MIAKDIIAIATSIIISVGGSGVIICALANFISERIAKRIDGKYQQRFEQEFEKYKSIMEHRRYISKTQFDNEYQIYKQLSKAFFSVAVKLSSFEYKRIGKTYKEYRLQLMDTLKQSDDYFYSIRTPLSIATNVYYNVGTDICHGEYCGNTILCGIYMPFKGFDNSMGPKIRDMSVVAGKLASFFCLGKPYAYEYDHICELSSPDYHFFNNCPLKLNNEVGFVLFSILCSINYCIVFVEKYITEEIPQKFKFCYLMYYYLCDFILDLNKETGLNLFLNSDLKKRELRNCLAHYGLGQYIKNSDIVQSDVLNGLTIKAFKKDYFEVKEELYKFMNELADQIKRIIF